MKHNDPPFTHIIDTRGYYTQDYLDWAVQRDNYPGSSLMCEDLGGDSPDKTIDGIPYIDTGIPFTTRKMAEIEVKKIRNLNGLAVIIPCTQQGTKKFKIWYNPNGSHDARKIVLGW